MKGLEFQHVILYEYNLLGGRETSQDTNLLYIALTRCTQKLTLLLNQSTRHIMSPFLNVLDHCL